MRVGLPLWGRWNPAKVLPETLMSLVGALGAWVIRPIVGDYVVSILIATMGVLVERLHFFTLKQK